MGFLLMQMVQMDQTVPIRGLQGRGMEAVAAVVAALAVGMLVLFIAASLIAEQLLKATVAMAVRAVYLIVITM